MSDARLNFAGKTAAAVLGMLAERHATVPQWRVQNQRCDPAAGTPVATPSPTASSSAAAG